MEEPTSIPSPVGKWIVQAPFNELQSLSYGLTPKEEAAMITSNDWVIFSIHGNYVRPRRDYEWYPGEPCRLKSFASGKMFERPPGSVPYSTSGMGHSATSWDAFVFPNPPRMFLMSQQWSEISPYKRPSSQLSDNDSQEGDRGIWEMGLGGLCAIPNGRLRYFRRRTKPQVEYQNVAVPSIHLDDLERQLWMDPEPRFEKPFRIYADAKYCTRGAKFINVSELVRPGW